MEKMNKLSFDTLSEAQNYFLKKGYTTQFDTKDGEIIAYGKDKNYQPKELLIIADFRFEGMTSPEDNMILYIIEANDGVKGTMVDSVGAEAAQDPELMREIPMKEK
ncbi:phosphoribosylpyrophosphate synthetase [Weeksellaceae bacterium TAE3-ERU29]|nr:phosphoribosylpyrophosphate synthetase [Weeksellaceae bacterium TAE3-ERU29]